jgi:dienelactone hydrolase
MKQILVRMVIAMLAMQARAAIHTEKITYKEGDVELHGYLAYDKAVSAKRPAVLVVHEWWGLNDHARSKAEALAKAGYVALALDMYGEGKTTEHPEKAGEWAGYIRNNMDVGRQRFNAGLDKLRKHPLTLTDQVAAIGYCFGGTMVLAMAQSGAALKGVVSFHGGLPTGPVEEGAVKARVLVCNGAADSMVPAEDIAQFQKNMTDAGADWQFINYGGAKHSFTNPNADKRGIPALAYNAAADRRSWRATLSLFEEIFGK